VPRGSRTVEPWGIPAGVGERRTADERRGYWTAGGHELALKACPSARLTRESHRGGSSENNPQSPTDFGDDPGNHTARPRLPRSGDSQRRRRCALPAYSTTWRPCDGSWGADISEQLGSHCRAWLGLRRCCGRGRPHSGGRKAAVGCRATPWWKAKWAEPQLCPTGGGRW
jgi:hypothetical protein